MESMTKHDYKLRNCFYCKREFVPKKLDRRHVGKYCSRKCYFNGVARKNTKKCAYCGKQFIVVIGTREKYCSRNCSANGHRGQNNPSGRGGKKKKECPICKRIFFVRPGSSQHTCSFKCSGERARGTQTLETNPNWRGGGNRQCIVCSKQFWSTPSSNKVFCSRSCFHKASFGKRSSTRFSHQTKWGYGTPKAGHRNDLGIYVRSSWEANYARYLNFLVKNGVIKSWDYEPDTFEFIGIKRGTRFYTPDFKVRNKDGQIEYHEVKGWMTPKSRTALDRMSRYYPDVKIVLIAKKEYELLQRKIKPLIPLWEGK